MTRTAFRLLLVALFACGASAQTGRPTGAIQGSVIDPSGAVISDAAVTARESESGISRAVTTDARGLFHIPALPAGTYTLRVEKPGFAPLEVKPFLVSVGEVAVHRLSLQVAGVAGNIEVTERPDAIESSATSSSAALGYTRIEEAPAKGRNYLNFVSLAPGLVASRGAGVQRNMAAIRSPLADSGFSFGGLRGRNNSLHIDGVDNRDETTGGSRAAIGLEMVQEFRVAGVAVGAEFGGAAGGMVNVVTRTGQNVWHGDVTYFFQNEALNSKKPEVPGGLKPRSRRYQPGTSLSGPVRKNRTFFAAAVEYERESAQEWSETPEEAALVINRILAGTSLPASPVRSVLRGLFDTGARGTGLSSKFNHQSGGKDALTARYAYSSGRVLDDVQGVENFQDHSAGGNSRTTDHLLAGSWIRVVSPAVVHELRFQAARRSQVMRPNSTGPMFEIPGVVTFGEAFRLNSSRTEDHYEAVENISFAAGRHRMSAGLSVHAIRLRARFANRFGGIYVFPTLGDFERGRPDVFLQAFGQPATRAVTVPVGLWLQDRWALRTGVNAEAGIRYDRQRMPAGLPRPAGNVSPRFGLAWRPYADVPFVLRAGVGLFYDRYPLAYLNEALQKNGSDAFEQYAAGDAAVQALRMSRGGTLPAPLPGLSVSAYRASPDFPSTYSRKVSFGAERGLGKDTTLSVEASSIRGFHLPRIRNAGGKLPPAYLLEQTGRSAYRGASISLNRRYSGGVLFLAAYDAGRAEDDGSDFDEQPMNPLDIRLDWARSRQYQLHRFVASGVFDIPAGALPPGRLREVLEEWTISPAFTWGSGRPVNALLTTDAWRTGAYPLTARPAAMPRNPCLSPSNVSLDARLMKTVWLRHERVWLQFGVESFNLLNRFNAVKVSEYFAAGSQRLASYGETIESGGSRQIQIFVQLEF